MTVDVEIVTPGGIIHVPGVLEGNRVRVRLDPGLEVRAAIGDAASEIAKRSALGFVDALVKSVRGR